MIDFSAARLNMVESQVRVNAVTDSRVIDALSVTARERFVPSSRQGVAYMDEDIRIDDGDTPRFLMEPRVFGRLLQAAEIAPDDLVLDLGCGTGYSSAILSRLAGTVVALEADEVLAARASELLSQQNADNVAVVTGPLNEGWVAEAPYNVIFVNGMVSSVPDSWLSQLAEGGRLVVVTGDHISGKAQIYLRSGESCSGRDLFDAHIRFLPGFEPVKTFVF